MVDVKPNTSQQMPVRGAVLPGGQFRAINVPLKELITFAFDARDEEIIGAPGWVETEHYDLVGKAPTAEAKGALQRSTPAVELMGVSYRWDDRFRKMVEAALADRFKLAFHREQRQMRVLALIVAKGGPKVAKAFDLSARPDCVRLVGRDVQLEATCNDVTMADFARAMQGLAPIYVDRRVIDLTELTDAYDINVRWFGKPNPDADAAGIGLPTAIEKQLGLKLEARRLPVTTIVIDHIERPSSN